MCERIKAKHPDILERQADGLYRYQLGSPEMSQVLFAFLTCQRVADAHRAGLCTLGCRRPAFAGRRCLSQSRWV